MSTLLEHSPLGQARGYVDQYDPSLLFAVPRAAKRQEIGLDCAALPFTGLDCWNHYEVSWLNARGKPMVATATLQYACDTPCIVESKSLKLYFNSFNQTRVASLEVIENTIAQDVSTCVGGPVTIKITPLSSAEPQSLLSALNGICLDELDIDCDDYQVDPQLLSCESALTTETIYSHLLKSNCLVTNQPDWGSVVIHYSGPRLNHENLLRYLISFRNHNEFHEQCVERIFNDLWQRCRPSHLTVYARYTRRGGLDINPYRSSDPHWPLLNNSRLLRQ